MTKKGTYSTDQAYTYRKIHFGGFVMFCTVIFENWNSSFQNDLSALDESAGLLPELSKFNFVSIIPLS
jgi:hypothetical protein